MGHFAQGCFAAFEGPTGSKGLIGFMGLIGLIGLRAFASCLDFSRERLRPNLQCPWNPI